MSANVFATIGPLSPFARIGGAALCGTLAYPVGLTLAELGIWFWGTQTVDSQNATTATAGAITGFFDGGIVEYRPTSPDRRTAILSYEASISTPHTQQVEVDQSGAVNIFSSVPTYACAYDGALWYPHILVTGQIFVDDGLGNGVQLSWSSAEAVSGLWPNAGSASVFGKTVPLAWRELSGGSTSVSFASPTVTFDSDWPYV